MHKVIFITFFLLLNSCSSNSFKLSGSKIKNVILLIGDGMGPQQLGLLHTYAYNAPNSI